MILITGATGNVGRHLVAELLTAGRKVRALSRDPATAGLPSGAEVARADEAPMDGVEAVFFNPATSWNGPGELLAKAKAHGVRRVVMLSSMSCLGEDDPANLIGQHHLEAEREIEASGLEWTFLRPGAFAANTLDWAGQIREDGVVRGPYARAHTTPMHERDIAEAAAQAFLADDLVGTKPVLSGPESLTHADQARIIGEAIGRSVRYEELSPETAREAMIGGGVPAPFVDAMLRMYASAVDTPAEVYPEFEQITGRRARTFAEWAADHAPTFS
ncbi:NAD(P)H-binding protein [Actinomadura rudentiformis]|uniref:NAD(P)H-binding protein n=1 Tax=Actinomadura rudentiformis TaxID=359158 RepID=A0A6H9YQD7_9ACTN|nr:NAD(P)H-binding protein [Actinomadura rudentiformis]KAB2345966.1 NAD(P)H-binding protein [Actinomadura rudentiformis]